MRENGPEESLNSSSGTPDSLPRAPPRPACTPRENTTNFTISHILVRLRNNPRASEPRHPALPVALHRGNVRIDLWFQQVERERTVAQHGVVEVADVETGAERLLGLPPQSLISSSPSL